VKRVRLTFAGFEVEFVDRERALRQISEWAERGTLDVHIVYGPEGCGKTALLKQAKAVLEEEFGYHVIYASPLAEDAKEILYTPSIREIVEEVLKAPPDPRLKLVDVVIAIVKRVMRKVRRPKIAVLMDDIQAVGLDEAERYTKTLLNLIEHPPEKYEKIVVLVASSEGVTWERVGRHSWVDIFVMWNMPRSGFEQLYDALPGPKPPFNEVWKWAGGNPRYLYKLFESGWSAEVALGKIIREKTLHEWAATLDSRARALLEEALEDPDALFYKLGEEAARRLRDELVAKNLISKMWERDESGWLDTPPPEKDPELGIGRYYAWQTPLHREAVKRTIRAASR